LVAQPAGQLDARSAEALADSALGVVGKVDRVVTPEGAVVVPEVVVRIVRENADRSDGCLFHGVWPFGFAPGTGTMKKPPAPSGAAVSYRPWRFLLFGSFDPHIAWVFPSKPPWDFLQFLGRHPAVFEATGIPDVGERIARHRRGATGACVIVDMTRSPIAGGLAG
jgi:hypothetical protein